MFESIGTFLLVCAIFVYVFHWLGGFELIHFFKTRQLQQHVMAPSESPPIQEKMATLKKGQLEPLTALETQLVGDAVTGHEAWVERLYDQYANDINVRYLYGVFLIRKGWLARGKGGIQSVKSEDIDLFVNALQRAEFVLSPLLETAGQLRPAVLEQLLLIYKGIAKGEDAQTLYAQYATSHKTALGLHVSKLAQMAVRWGGDNREMFNAARNISKNGQFMPVALAVAWVELAIDQDKKHMKKNLQQSEDKSSIINAFQALAEVPKDLKSMADYHLVQAYNIYAAYFYLLGDYQHAKKALSKTIGFYMEYPWKYLHENPKDAYMKALSDCKVRTFH